MRTTPGAARSRSRRVSCVRSSKKSPPGWVTIAGQTDTLLASAEELAASGEEQSASTEEILFGQSARRGADRLTGAVKSFRLLADEVRNSRRRTSLRSGQPDVEHIRQPLQLVEHPIGQCLIDVDRRERVHRTTVCVLGRAPRLVVARDVDAALPSADPTRPITPGRHGCGITSIQPSGTTSTWVIVDADTRPWLPPMSAR